MLGLTDYFALKTPSADHSSWGARLYPSVRFWTPQACKHFRDFNLRVTQWAMMIQVINIAITIGVLGNRYWTVHPFLVLPLQSQKTTNTYKKCNLYTISFIHSLAWIPVWLLVRVFIVRRVDFQATTVLWFTISQALFVLFVFSTVGSFVLAYGGVWSWKWSQTVNSSSVMFGVWTVTCAGIIFGWVFMAFRILRPW